MAKPSSDCCCGWEVDFRPSRQYVWVEDEVVRGVIVKDSFYDDDYASPSGRRFKVINAKNGNTDNISLNHVLKWRDLLTQVEMLTYPIEAIRIMGLDWVDDD